MSTRRTKCTSGILACNSIYQSSRNQAPNFFNQGKWNDGKWDHSCLHLLFFRSMYYSFWGPESYKSLLLMAYTDSKGMTCNASKMLPPNRTSPGPLAVHSNPLLGSSFWVVQNVVWPLGCMFLGSFPHVVAIKQVSSSDTFSGNPLTVDQILCSQIEVLAEVL